MPEQLLGRIIRACSQPGDLVLDPFGGSGTTLAVAKKLGRSFLGLELSEQYATRIKERLASIRTGDTLDGAPEPLKSVPATKDGRRLARSSRKR
jgi:site-specific DNA-methyltransferase (adenine-specific)